MKYECLKIYGMCLERLKPQIRLAREHAKTMNASPDRMILECYFTSEVEDIIDVLELYDRQYKILKEKAANVSS